MNTPLEAYELTKRDYREQKTAESIHAHVEKLSAEWRDEELQDPVLARKRSERVRETLRRFMQSPTPDHMIMRWRVRLYCGDIVETTRHSENEEPTRHGSSSMQCPTCGMNPARIVGYEPIGLRAQPPMRAAQPKIATTRRPTRQQLEHRIAELEAQLAARDHGQNDGDTEAQE